VRRKRGEEGGEEDREREREEAWRITIYPYKIARARAYRTRR